MNAPPGRLDATRDKVLRLHGHAVVADPSGVLYWPDEHLLVVADLHLEKGSAYATRRVFLPPYDTTATLTALAAVVARLNPRRVVALGDSFHDGGGAARMPPRDLAHLRAMQTGREWLWIAGNHDPAAPHGLDGDHAVEWAIGALTFRHEPLRGPADGEIAGHLHPVARVVGRSGALRRRCFATDGSRLILPAFGAYAGGLNIRDVAFSRVFGGREHHAHVLGHDAVYTIARRQCAADAVAGVRG